MTQTETIKASRARFARDTADHAMTVVLDEGLHRHLQFRRQVWQPPLAKPGRTSLYRFDLITVPGTLIFQGDGESFVFSRIEDMFEFFRSPSCRINPGYWAEKLTSSRDAAMSYSRDYFLECVKYDFVEACRDREIPPGTGRAIRDAFELDYNIDYEEEARRFLDNFEFEGFRFVNTHEWNLHDFDWWFLWACNAIAWGIAQYDASGAAAAGPTTRAA